MFGVDEQKCPRLPLFAGRAAHRRSWVGLRTWGKVGARPIAVRVAESPSVSWYLPVAGRCRHPPRQLFDGDPQRARTVRHRVRPPRAAAGRPGAVQ